MPRQKTGLRAKGLRSVPSIAASLWLAYRQAADMAGPDLRVVDFPSRGKCYEYWTALAKKIVREITPT